MKTSIKPALSKTVEALFCSTLRSGDRLLMLLIGGCSNIDCNMVDDAPDSDENSKPIKSPGLELDRA